MAHVNRKSLEYVMVGTALNVLDVWLPIYAELVGEHVNARAVVVFPFPWILQTPPHDDVLVILADDLGVECIVIFEQVGMRFVTVSAAMKFVRKKPLRLLAAFVGAMYRRRFGSGISAALAKMSSIAAIERIDSKEWQASRLLLFDWTHGATGGIYGDWFSNSEFIWCFASNHAGYPIMHSDCSELVGQAISPSVRARTTALVSKKGSRPVEGLRVKYCGLARHDARWLHLIVAASREMHPLPPKPLVLFSRGFGSGWLGKTTTYGRDERTQIIRTAHDVAQRLGLHLVIKLHPQEINDIESILGKTDQAAPTYSVSAGHPLHLALDSLASLIISTSVVADCLRVGSVPIDILDVGSTESTPSGDHPTKLFTRELQLLKVVTGPEDLETALKSLVESNCWIERRLRMTVPEPLHVGYTNVLVSASKAAKCAAKEISL